MLRKENRETTQIRPVNFEMDINNYAEGSCIVSYGNTRVLCTASLEENVPRWLQNTNKGWVTAEYSMLPRSTHTRIRRDKAMSGGRSQEISRLIGRALRSCVDMSAIPEKSIIVDCDVIQADGGTRTASITGGFVALARALEFLKQQDLIKTNPLKFQVAALSSGLVNNKPLVDLDYDEDSNCDSDINFVFTSKNELIEVQGTAEGAPFNSESFQNLLNLTQKESELLFQKQKQALGWETLLA